MGSPLLPGISLREYVNQPGARHMKVSIIIIACIMSWGQILTAQTEGPVMDLYRKYIDLYGAAAQPNSNVDWDKLTQELEATRKQIIASGDEGTRVLLEQLVHRGRGINK